VRAFFAAGDPFSTVEHASGGLAAVHDLADRDRRARSGHTGAQGPSKPGEVQARSRKVSSQIVRVALDLMLERRIQKGLRAEKTFHIEIPKLAQPEQQVYWLDLPGMGSLGLSGGDSPC
jgi:hypothetical protein